MGSLRLLNRHPELLGLAGVTFLYHLAHDVLPAVAVLYTSYRYGWDTQTMGLSLAAVGIASGVVQGGLIQPAIRGSASARRCSSGCCSASSDLRSTAWRRPARGSGPASR